MPQSRMQITLPNEILLEEVAALLDEGREVEIMSKGTSMLPFIVGGRDSVILRKEATGVQKPGDIVLARRSPGNYVLHRLISVDGDRVTLKGDGNVFGTETVALEDVLGKVMAVVSPSGRRRVPGNAYLWRNLNPFVRRCFLALYRRTVYKIITKDEN